MVQKQKTASAWAGLPCSFSTSKVSYLSAWPGEEGGGGVQAWRTLLLGFQRAASLLQRANLPQELSLLAPRMRTAQGDHSSSRKRCNSEAAWMHRLRDLPSSRLLAEGKPNFASTEQGRKLRHKQEGKCAWSHPNSAKRSTDPQGQAHAATEHVWNREFFVRVQGERSQPQHNTYPCHRERPPSRRKRRGFGKAGCIEGRADGVLAEGAEPSSRQMLCSQPLNRSQQSNFCGFTSKAG